MTNDKLLALRLPVVPGNAKPARFDRAPAEFVCQSQEWGCQRQATPSCTPNGFTPPIKRLRPVVGQFDLSFV